MLHIFFTFVFNILNLFGYNEAVALTPVKHFLTLSDPEIICYIKL